MTSTTNSWAQLRQKARSLESRTESLFHSYSQFTSSPPPKPSSDELDLEAQLEDVLQKRESTISALSRLLDSESALTSSAAKLQNLTLHRSNLASHRSEFQRLKSQIQHARNSSNLLTSVRADINAYRASSRTEQGLAAGMSEGDYFLDERARLEQSNSVADSVLNTAYAMNADFHAQRQRLQGINRRIVGAASKIPGINVLVNKISARKKRDSIIIAAFVGFCFLMLLYFR